jgi:hypothetical protein
LEANIPCGSQQTKNIALIVIFFPKKRILSRKSGNPPAIWHILKTSQDEKIGIRHHKNPPEKMHSFEKHKNNPSIRSEKNVQTVHSAEKWANGPSK